MALYHNKLEQIILGSKLSLSQIRERIGLSRSRDDEKVYLLFVVGHIDDLMGGYIPEPDDSDPRTRGVDEK